MAKNSDGSVTLKTTGKVASNPSGSGTAQTKPVQAKSSVQSPKVVKVPGRKAVPRTTASGGKSSGRRGR